MVNLTPRETDIVNAIRAGARTCHMVAAALEPQVSPRTVQELVYRMIHKLPDDGSPPFQRVVVFALTHPAFLHMESSE